MNRLPPPSLTFLCNMELTVEGAHLPGKTPVGNRRIIRVTGGNLRGDLLDADVIPGGDDWITVREDGTIIQDVRILLRTVDQELVLMTYRGIRAGEPEVLQRLDEGQEVDPAEYYFRTAPIFETSSPKYDWLNRRLFVSRGVRLPDKVFYSIYMVE